MQSTTIDLHADNTNDFQRILRVYPKKVKKISKHCENNLLRLVLLQDHYKTLCDYQTKLIIKEKEQGQITEQDETSVRF